MDDTIKTLSQYGIAGVLMLVIGWVLYKIGLRMIAAIDNLGTKWETTSDRIVTRIDEHTKADVAVLGALVTRVELLEKSTDDQHRTLERLRDDIADVLERTPVGSIPTRTTASGVIEDRRGRERKG